jgi:hypothetical protein
MKQYIIRENDLFGGYDIFAIYQAKPRARKQETRVARGLKRQDAIDYARLLSVAEDLPIKKQFDFTEEEKQAILKIRDLAYEYCCSWPLFIENVLQDGLQEMLNKIHNNQSIKDIVNSYI